MPLPPAWGRFLADWPRGARLGLLVAFVVIVAWLFALPSPFFQQYPAALWLEGPVPAWIGAAVGLRQAHALIESHRARGKRKDGDRGPVRARPFR